MSVRVNSNLEEVIAIPSRPAAKAASAPAQLDLPDGNLPAIEDGGAADKQRQLLGKGAVISAAVPLMVAIYAIEMMKSLFLPGFGFFFLLFGAVFVLLALSSVANIALRGPHRRRALERRIGQARNDCWLALTGGPLDLAPAEPEPGFVMLHADRETSTVDDDVQVRFVTRAVSFDGEQGWRYYRNAERSVLQLSHAAGTVLSVSMAKMSDGLKLNRESDERESALASASDPAPPVSSSDPYEATALIRSGKLEGYRSEDADRIVALPAICAADDFATLAEQWASYCAEIDRINSERWQRLESERTAKDALKELLASQRENAQLLPPHRA